MSRCIKSIPSREENSSEFLVATHSNTNACLMQASFNNETRKLTCEEVVDFEKVIDHEGGKKVVNEILGIYCNSDKEQGVESGGENEMGNYK